MLMEVNKGMDFGRGGEKEGAPRGSCAALGPRVVGLAALNEDHFP